MANFVLIAGTFHGGWYWDPIKDELLQRGHVVYAPTLSGLEEKTSSKSINLDTHIQDVTHLIEKNSLENVILVGWSYGGMVITGVADRARAHVKKIIYLDAQLPKPGEREWDLMPVSDQNSTLSESIDGLYIYPNQWLQNYEPRTRPHPLATKLQPLLYDQASFNLMPKVFVFAEKWFHDPTVISPIKRSYDQASQTPGWELHSWPFGHDLVRECKEKVINLLLQQVD